MRDVKMMLVRLKQEIAAESSNMLLKSPQHINVLRQASVGRAAVANFSDRKRIGASPLAALSKRNGVRSRQHSRFKSSSDLGFLEN